MRRSALLAGALAIACLAAPAAGRDLYAERGGDDLLGDGTRVFPWRSITRALSSAVRGDVVHLDDSLYSAGSGEVFPLRVPPGVTVIGSVLLRSEVAATASDVAFLFEGVDAPEDTVISRVRISGARVGVQLEAAPLVRLAPRLDRVLVGATTTAFAVRGTGEIGLEMEECQFFGSRRPDAVGLEITGEPTGTVRVVGGLFRQAATGVRLEAGGDLAVRLDDVSFDECASALVGQVLGTGSVSVSLSRCTFEGTGDGVLLLTDPLASGCSLDASVTDSVLALGPASRGIALDGFADDCPAHLDVVNTFVHGGDGIALGGTSTTPATATVLNCTLADLQGVGLMASLPKTMQVQNSIVWSAGLPMSGDGVNPWFSDYPGGGTRGLNFDADPLFVDPAGGDYHLGPGSPCIDRAAPFAPERDFEGDERSDDPALPNGAGARPFADVGADERVDPAADSDGDGLLDTDDNCPLLNPSQQDSDGDGRGDPCDDCPGDPRDDEDEDGRCANVDDCDTVANAGQEDLDGDLEGDACDLDDDADGVPDFSDVCPRVADPAQADADADGVGDACDPCPLDPGGTSDTDRDGVCDNTDNCLLLPNALQEDADTDGLGDACDPCPLDPGAGADLDGDGVCNDDDACPTVPDPGQGDLDADGLGDACDPDADGDGLDLAAGDCDDLDATALRAPSEVAGVRVTFAAGVLGVRWDAQDAVAGTGVRYDLLEGPLAWFRFRPWQDATCAASALATPSVVLAPSSSRWLLVRARNACAVGTWGDSSITPDPRDDLDASSPCP